jgi:hypothetical protein
MVIGYTNPYRKPPQFPGPPKCDGEQYDEIFCISTTNKEAADNMKEYLQRCEAENKLDNEILNMAIEIINVYRDIGLNDKKFNSKIIQIGRKYILGENK